MESDDPRLGLGIERRFVYAVGEAAQLGAGLESNLCHLLSSLMPMVLDPKPQKRLPPVSDVLNDCAKMLPDVFIDPALLALAQQTLLTAQTALEDRNRIVHDRWLGEADDPSVMTRMRSLPGGERGALGHRVIGEASGLAEFEQTVIDLGRAIHQIGSLGQLAWSHRFGPSPMDAHSLAIVRGEFDLYGINAARLHDPSLAP